MVTKKRKANEEKKASKVKKALHKSEVVQDMVVLKYVPKQQILAKYI